MGKIGRGYIEEKRARATHPHPTPQARHVTPPMCVTY
jgi:hypothetical protein